MNDVLQETGCCTRSTDERRSGREKRYAVVKTSEEKEVPLQSKHKFQGGGFS
jgi:hypothetical protein